MTTIGICVKCGKLKEVRQHHFKGYTTDETVRIVGAVIESLMKKLEKKETAI